MGIRQYVDKSELDAMKAERDALAAQVEVLKKPLQSMVNLIASGDEPGECSEWYKSAISALEATPQQHLEEIKIPANAEEAAGMALISMSWLENNAPEKLTELHKEIRAKAGRDGFIAGVSLMRGNRLAWLKVDEFANQYADSIRRGEVK